MNTSPFLPPSGRRRSREAARRRRIRRRRIFLGTVLCVALAALFALTRPFGIASSPAASRRARGALALAHSAGGPGGAGISSGPSLSPVGLPLGRPPLTLELSDPAADPVRIAFPSPPRAGLLFNLSSGRILWQLHPLARLRVASLTKMMTALLVVRSAPPSARVLITRAAVEAGGSKVGVLPLGRRVRLESLLYGLLLPSGNDAAVALAEHVAGTVKRFVGEMNASAAALGLGCTRYSSPSGFFDAHNFSCAADLAELASADLAQPRIARIVRSADAAVPFPIRGGRLYLANNNPLLLYSYPGTTGLKTGYTVEAGRCLVATASRRGVRLGVVLLHSPAPGTQAEALLNDAFRSVYHLPPVAAPPLPPGA